MAAIGDYEGSLTPTINKVKYTAKQATGDKYKIYGDIFNCRMSITSYMNPDRTTINTQFGRLTAGKAYYVYGGISSGSRTSYLIGTEKCGDVSTINSKVAFVSDDAFPVAYYEIRYHSNSGTDVVTNMPKDQQKQQGVTITVGSQRPVRDGYEFLGWCKDAAGNYPFVNALYYEDADLDLYAKWSGTIKYDAGEASEVVEEETMPANTPASTTRGTTISSTVPKTKEVVTTGSYLLLVDLIFTGTMQYEIVNRELKTFKSWKASTGLTYSPGEAVQAGTDATLVAQWETVDTTDTIDLPTQKVNGTQWEFKGWCQDSLHNPGQKNVHTGSYKPTSLDNMYAIWRPNLSTDQLLTHRTVDSDNWTRVYLGWHDTAVNIWQRVDVTGKRIFSGSTPVDNPGTLAQYKFINQLADMIKQVIANSWYRNFTKDVNYWKRWTPLKEGDLIEATVRNHLTTTLEDLMEFWTTAKA